MDFCLGHNFQSMEASNLKLQTKITHECAMYKNNDCIPTIFAVNALCTSMISFYCCLSLRLSGPTYGHILAHLSKPLLGLLVGYVSDILGYKKSVLTFRHHQKTGRCERSFGVLRVRTWNIGITIIFIIIVFNKNLFSNSFNFMEFGRFGQILWTKLRTEHLLDIM